MNAATIGAITLTIGLLLGRAFASLAVAVPPTAEGMRQLDYVAEVTTNTIEQPTRRIIHILDWHLIGAEHFKDAAEFEKHLEQVQAVQVEQVKLLSALGIDAVYAESLTPENMNVFAAQLRVIAKTTATLSEVAELTAVDEELVAAVAELERRHRIMCAGVGAAGQLMIGERLRVKPAESIAEYRAAKPKIEGDKVIKDDTANEKREAAIVRNVLTSDAQTVVLILGGTHDLGDNLPDGCEYLRVRVRSYPQ